MMKAWKLLAALILVSALECACIGRQPAQQGTWSRQDGFRTRITDGAGHSPANPE